MLEELLLTHCVAEPEGVCDRPPVALTVTLLHVLGEPVPLALVVAVRHSEGLLVCDRVELVLGLCEVQALPE